MIAPWVVVLWLHILAGAVWVGGLVSLTFFAVILKEAVSLPERIRVMGALGRKMSWVFWSMLLIAILTGLGNVMARGLPVTALLDLNLLAKTRFGQLVLIKSLMVVAVLVLTWYHSFVAGPRLLEKGVEGKADRETIRRLRMRVVMANGLNIILGVLILLIGALLRYS